MSEGAESLKGRWMREFERFVAKVNVVCACLSAGVCECVWEWV